MNVEVSLIFAITLINLELEEALDIHYPIIIKLIEIKDEPSILRTGGILNSDPGQLMKNRSIHGIKDKQLERMKVVIDHVKEYFMSCLYLYNEVERIKREGKVMNEGREVIKMFDMLRDQGGHEETRENFINCITAERVPPTAPPWYAEGAETNNLVINTLKDPYNDNAM